MFQLSKKEKELFLKYKQHIQNKDFSPLIHELYREPYVYPESDPNRIKIVKFLLENDIKLYKYLDCINAELFEREQFKETDIKLNDECKAIYTNGFAYTNITSIVGKGVELLAGDAFYGCKNLKYASFPNCKNIFSQPFHGCPFVMCPSLVEVDLRSLKEINFRIVSFEGCTGLEKIIIGTRTKAVFEEQVYAKQAEIIRI